MRGRPRPRLGGGEVDSTWRAFPFSAAENFLGGAMKKKEKQEGIDWKDARHSILITGEGQPSASTIAGNHDRFLRVGTRQFVQLPRHRGGAEPPTSNQPPCGARGRRLLGPAALRTCPFASLLSQVRARLGPGGYYRCSWNGGPQTCLPAACGVAQVGAQCGPASSGQAQDPREGPNLAGRTTGSLVEKLAQNPLFLYFASGHPVLYGRPIPLSCPDIRLRPVVQCSFTEWFLRMSGTLWTSGTFTTEPFLRISRLSGRPGSGCPARLGRPCPVYWVVAHSFTAAGRPMTI